MNPNIQTVLDFVACNAHDDAEGEALRAGARVIEAMTKHECKLPVAPKGHAQIKADFNSHMLTLDGFDVYLYRDDDGMVTLALRSDGATGLDVFPRGGPVMSFVLNDERYETRNGENFSDELVRVT